MDHLNTVQSFVSASAVSGGYSLLLDQCGKYRCHRGSRSALPTTFCSVLSRIREENSVLAVEMIILEIAVRNFDLHAFL